MRKVISLIFSLLIFCGCVSTLSQRPPYSQYVKQPLTLQEEAILQMTEAWSGETMDMLFSAPKPIFGLYNLADPVLRISSTKDKETIRLPKGTPLTILKVVERTTDGGASIEAHGTIHVAAKGGHVPFIYNWSYQCDPYLKRAPWEDVDIDEKLRVLKYGGCS